MSYPARRWVKRVAGAVKNVLEPAVSFGVVALLKAIRRTDPDRIADRAGRFMRRVGPWLPEHRTGRANLAAAFPEKSAEEIEEVLRGVWDNLGRFAAEFAHIDRMRIFDPANPGAANID